MPFAHLNDTDLFYTEVGSGQPCLVMHGGLGGDHRCLHPWLDPLGDDLRVIYYDHRCNGRSGRPPLVTMTYDQLADDADALREHLGLGPITVLGHSAGAAIALHYVLKYPANLNRLILMSGHAAWDYGDEILEACRQREASDEVLEVFTGPPPKDDSDLARMVRSLMSVYLSRFDPRLTEEYVSNVRWDAAANVRYGELLREHDVVSRLGEIKTPTLIVVGRDDVVTPVEQAERLHRGILGSEMVIFEHSGHLPYLEEQDLFIQTVRAWLRDHSMMSSCW